MIARGPGRGSEGEEPFALSRQQTKESRSLGLDHSKGRLTKGSHRGPEHSCRQCRDTIFP